MNPASPPIANTPMLLIDILAELRGLRADLATASVGTSSPVAVPEPVDGETVELRGVDDAKPTKRRRA